MLYIYHEIDNGGKQDHEESASICISKEGTKQRCDGCDSSPVVDIFGCSCEIFMDHFCEVGDEICCYGKVA